MWYGISKVLRPWGSTGFPILSKLRVVQRAPWLKVLHYPLEFNITGHYMCMFICVYILFCFFACQYRKMDMLFFVCQNRKISSLNVLTTNIYIICITFYNVFCNICILGDEGQNIYTSFKYF